LQAAYQEMGAPTLGHLATTVEQHLSPSTPLWWAVAATQPVGCLWLGTALDQWTGERQAYVLLVYVEPDYRRRGIGAALLHTAHAWARGHGYAQISLQVFETNQAALQLYQRLGYQPHTRGLLRSLTVADA
jgi:GNAT superfamily N-acetyltransferase